MFGPISSLLFQKLCDQCYTDVLDVEYSMYAISCKHCFGCVNLKRKKYCILNKEYTKEEYEKLKARIIEDMKKNPYKDKTGKEYSYGEFFPMEFSRFPYNETLAQLFFPKTKEEVTSAGLSWHEGAGNEYVITKKAEELSDKISEIGDEILKEVIACKECGKAYRFTLGELNLMKKLSLPLPRKCFSCRQKVRFTRTNPPKLWKRHCAKCQKEIETSYSPERPEIIYCESCYQGEVL